VTVIGVNAICPFLTTRILCNGESLKKWTILIVKQPHIGYILLHKIQVCEIIKITRVISLLLRSLYLNAIYHPVALVLLIILDGQQMYPATEYFAQYSFKHFMTKIKFRFYWSYKSASLWLKLMLISIPFDAKWWDESFGIYIF
jgi:hypothetical protein